MKHLTTEIEINASRNTIWQVLMDFSSYPEWNPFIVSITGNPTPGGSLQVTLQGEGMKPMQIKPICIQSKDQAYFSWKGKLLVKGIFDGEHIFELVQLTEDKVRFKHYEQFTGLLVPMIWNKIEGPTKAGFNAMNAALKKRCEAINE